MTIAPNGVTVADYDPRGIGALAFAAVSSSYTAGEILFGDNISGSEIYPCNIVDSSVDQVRYGGSDLGAGTVWKCLGFITDSGGDNGTLFMRVS
ncbi:hypothetical protein [Planktotalea arctica]|uniref:hypothetical protein n=1 Tax=Planktotalea arctica TaxID=1481893 RepID=UPI003219064B